MLTAVKLDSQLLGIKLNTEKTRKGILNPKVSQSVSADSRDKQPTVKKKSIQMYTNT